MQAITAQMVPKNGSHSPNAHCTPPACSSDCPGPLSALPHVRLLLLGLRWPAQRPLLQHCKPLKLHDSKMGAIVTAVAATEFLREMADAAVASAAIRASDAEQQHRRRPRQPGKRQSVMSLACCFGTKHHARAVDCRLRFAHRLVPCECQSLSAPKGTMQCAKRRRQSTALA
mgnify:CR=1 FL=1